MSIGQINHLLINWSVLQWLSVRSPVDFTDVCVDGSSSSSSSSSGCRIAVLLSYSVNAVSFWTLTAKKIPWYILWCFSFKIFHQTDKIKVFNWATQGTHIRSLPGCSVWACQWEWKTCLNKTKNNQSRRYNDDKDASGMVCKVRHVCVWADLKCLHKRFYLSTSSFTEELKWGHATVVLGIKLPGSFNLSPP